MFFLLQGENCTLLDLLVIQECKRKKKEQNTKYETEL